ncbi:MAG: Succinate-semialdehyde dehydrogenase [NAD]; Succinate-semialdehyde dehydrogenase [NADP+] [uncultured Adhaeribacter sp.]|uniref:Succinate-semialdehyde dehydrogenase [NAD] Succinate-semialdehyde dehydrogenase [NADP+] n=1 Tax=uncultured Adhaeribacter sp. TaxID=448109 RepID=A0A6J4J3E9_9BACT|nr:MAG: Succinate-semialdehyde dehydrogenase [NAD]; Succinate-semialdehyde dehydrogenase [NADP+] [uncultured Adhaeribacter sp.]
MAINSINPATNEVLKTFSPHTLAQVEQLLAQADLTFREWRQTPFSHRAALMRRAAQELKENDKSYATTITLEMGKPIREAQAEINKCALACEFYAEHAETYLQDEEISSDASVSYISYEPLGAVLAVMPWNFPFWQVFRFAAPAIMAGNVGILKHASNVPQCALAIEEVFRRAGFPEGIFTSLLISSDAVENLIQDERIKAVTLTGSEGAGAKVAAVAGREIKKTVLELGGSDAFIVLADADLENTALMAAKARMINTGQSCIAAKRFIVEERVAEAFIAKMKAHLQQFKTGDLLAPDTSYGPLARPDLAATVQKQVDDSVARGARILLAGGRPDNESAYFHPMMLTDIKPGMPAHDEEIFGPVACIFEVKNAEEAIRVANNCQYGLGGSIWSGNLPEARRLARQVEAGAVFINGIVQSHPALPFGGIKKSGYGRELSYVGIREFVNQKTIWVA